MPQRPRDSDTLGEVKGPRASGRLAWGPAGGKPGAGMFPAPHAPAGRAWGAPGVRERTTFTARSVALPEDTEQNAGG